MRKSLSLLAVILLSIQATASDKIITDQSKIDQFLKDPRTKVFGISTPKNWKNVSRYIEVGTSINGGGCSYSMPAELQNGAQTISIQIAVNSYTCQALTIEGTPDQESWNFFRRIFNKKSSSISENKSIGLMETEPSSRSMAASSAEQSESAFNSGGNTYDAINSDIYTDGNNDKIKLINSLGVIKTIAGEDLQFEAAGVDVRKPYSDPAVPPFLGNCYDNGGNNLSNVYPGKATYTTGYFGCKHQSVYACDARTTSHGRYDGNPFLTGIYYEQNLPGANFEMAKIGSLCGIKSRSLHNSSCNVPPYVYRETSISYNYYISSSSTFFNNSSLPGAFNCSQGITIDFSDISIYSDGISPAKFGGSSGWHGQTEECGENLLLIRTRKAPISNATE